MVWVRDGYGRCDQSQQAVGILWEFLNIDVRFSGNVLNGGEFTS